MPAVRTFQPVKAAVMLFLATSVWGATFLAMKALSLSQLKIDPHASSWLIAALALFVRFSVSALLLGLWAGRKVTGLTRLEFQQGAGLGFFCAAGILFQTDGVQYTAASTSAFLTQCYCIFIPVALAIHRRKLPGPGLALCCATAFAGMAILSNIDFRALRMGRGELESILSSFLFTGQILWLERPAYHGNRMTLVSLVMYAAIAVLVLPVLAAVGNGPGQCVALCGNAPAVWLLAFLTLGGTLATFTVMNHWQPHLSSTQAGLIYCCEPLFTSVFALFLPALLSAAFQIKYPNESVNTRMLLGGGLVTAANLLALRVIPPPSATPHAGDHAG